MNIVKKKKISWAIALCVTMLLGLCHLYIHPVQAEDNLGFTPPVDNLEWLLSRFGDDLSVYYENLESGFVFRFNAEREYFSASVPKAIFALYIFQKAERGEISLGSAVTFTEADYWGGSGVIRHTSSFGDTFTQRELLRLNVSESDNIATLMLRRVHGLAGYTQFISAIGGTPDFVRERVFNSQLTANEAGLYAREIFRYIESGGTYSEEFKAHLLDNQFPFIVARYPVASKTGWNRPSAWHDMAIIYAPSPFILVILSAREGWEDEDYEDFAEIARIFQQFNDTWFTATIAVPDALQPPQDISEDTAQDNIQLEDWIDYIIIAGVVIVLLLILIWGFRRYMRG